MGKIELDGSFHIILCVKTAKTNKYCTLLWQLRSSLPTPARVKALNQSRLLKREGERDLVEVFGRSHWCLGSDSSINLKVLILKEYTPCKFCVSSLPTKKIETKLMSYNNLYVILKLIDSYNFPSIRNNGAVQISLSFRKLTRTLREESWKQPTNIFGNKALFIKLGYQN